MHFPFSKLILWCSFTPVGGPYEQKHNPGHLLIGMWASVMLPMTIALLKILPKAYADKGLPYELDAEMDPRLEEDSAQDPGEPQQLAVTDFQPDTNEGLKGYAPFLLCLQRKKTHQKETPRTGTPYHRPGFKTQMNSWIQDMKSVEAELVKTRCQPREVCIQVSVEHPPSPSTFYVPKCVSVHRCGGCCHGEGNNCVNTSQTFIHKTLIEITIPPIREPRTVSMLFHNHTNCGCTSQLAQPRSIMKRASVDSHLAYSGSFTSQNGARAYRRGTGSARCNKLHGSCSSGLSWDPLLCLCVKDQKLEDFGGTAEGSSVCGAHRVFSEDSCSCVCRNSMGSSNCGPHKVFNNESCSCVCKNSLDKFSCKPPKVFSEKSCTCACEDSFDSPSCGPYRTFSAESCSCVCKNALDGSKCGAHKVFSEETCSCVCKNGLDKSSCEPHKVFHEDSCSCGCNGLARASCEPPMLLQDNTCACVCPGHAQKDSCKPDWGWDKEKCSCVCQKSCPKNKPLNMSTCQCECQEKSPGCTRRGSKFDPHSSATGHLAQGGGHDVWTTITIVILFATVFRST
ncbi:vascular endothelial growth factor C-like isoform X1 [Pleurodeles waltl]|uniref:vascular endothelial growth factor C-like isoform X1 n=1 Tax=Pleurodeles waltl TaxID=8319 RepID=UPI003709895C